VEDLVMARRRLTRFIIALGIGFFLAAIRSGFAAAPDTCGGPVTPAEIRSVSPEAVANLNALVADHSELLTLIRRDDEIWQWLAVHFTNHGRAVRWTRDRGVHFTHYLAMSSYTEPVLYLAARTPGGQPISPQLQLSEIVYELLNISHAGEFQQVVAGARAGALSEKEFVEAMARVEFRTCQETDAFHRLVWLPYAEKNHLPLYRGNWHIGIGTDFQRWLDYHRHVAKDGYPDDAYAPEYAALTGKSR
jgi:hypothetical protein